MSTAKRWLTLALVALCTAAPVRAAELSKYLSDDTEIVVGINVTAVVESDFVQKHVPALVPMYGPALIKLALASGVKIDGAVQKELEKLLADAGAVKKWLNEHKGVVRRVLIGTNADFDDASTVFILEGEFNKDIMKAGFDELARRKRFGLSVAKVKHEKHEFYSVKVPGEDEPMHMALADDNTLVCCQDKALLAKTLERARGAKPGAKRQLIELANKIDRRANLWMAAAPKEADEYVSAHISVIVTDGIKISASVLSKDADGARNMASDLQETLKEAADDLNDAAQQLPPLLALREILKNVEPKAEKNVVTIEAEVPGATLDKIIKELPAIK